MNHQGLIVSVTLGKTVEAWTEPFKDCLTKPLLCPQEQEGNSNVTFVCSNSENILWNGLPFLSSLSPLFKARSGEEQNFTIMIPDYQSSCARNLLLLLSMGSALVSSGEMDEITCLAKDLGVRNCIYNLFAFTFFRSLLFM